MNIKILEKQPLIVNILLFLSLRYLSGHNSSSTLMSHIDIGGFTTVFSFLDSAELAKTLCRVKITNSMGPRASFSQCTIVTASRILCEEIGINLNPHKIPREIQGILFMIYVNMHCGLKDDVVFFMCSNSLIAYVGADSADQIMMPFLVAGLLPDDIKLE